MPDFSTQSERYSRIERAIGFIEANFRTRPDLNEIARSVHLSRFHFDRLFKDWAGITPLQFLHYLSLDYAKKQLQESQSILDAALNTGFSGPGRLHDLFVSFDAMSPGEFKKKGKGLAISYGLHPTPFGTCILARTERGICHLAFLDATEDARTVAVRRLTEAWPLAHFQEEPHCTAPLVAHIFNPISIDTTCRFHLLLKGTNFQINVWKALLAIPAGHLVSYRDLATGLGQPQASRAVAGAVAANSLAYLIPCHRVILGSGRIHQYRWGSARKMAMIGWEAAIRQQTDPNS